MVNSKILIISGAPIRVIFQNSVTNSDDVFKYTPSQSLCNSFTTGLRKVFTFFFGSFGPGMQPIIITLSSLYLSDLGRFATTA